MSAGQRLQDYLAAVVATLKASGLFLDVRVQLDAYAFDDVLKENFRTPAARVFVLKCEPEEHLSSGFNINMSLGLVVITKREGRPDFEIATADMAAVSLVMDLAAYVQANRYFGLCQLTAAKLEGFRMVASESSTKGGVAITMLQISSTLLDMIPAWDGAAQLFDAARPDGLGLMLNGDPVPDAGIAP